MNTSDRVPYADESIDDPSAAAVATADMANLLRDELEDEEHNGIEVDAPHRELWVHEVDPVAEGLTRPAVKDFAITISAEAGSGLRYEYDLKKYPEESRADGYVIHISQVHFDYEDEE